MDEQHNNGKYQCLSETEAQAIFAPVKENQPHWADFVKRMTGLDAKSFIYRKNLEWEQIHNLRDFRKRDKDLTMLDMKMVPIPYAELDLENCIHWRELVPKHLKEAVESFYHKDDNGDDDGIYFPFHPFLDRRVPTYGGYEIESYIPWLRYADKAGADEKSVWVYATASRTVYHADPNRRGLAIKVGTNYVCRAPLRNGDRIPECYQPRKLHMETCVRWGIRNTRIMTEMDKLIGYDPQFTYAKEFFFAMVPSIYDAEGKLESHQNGFLLRDVSVLSDGYYYLPGFSVLSSQEGMRIAEKCGKREGIREPTTAKDTYLKFWEIHFAKKIGELKAKLFLRYSLQLITPNPQNFLIQLDPDDECPTGRMVLRDIEDADVFDNDMSHASLDEFKQLYDDDKNRIKQKSIEFLSNFDEMLVGWEENPVAITNELEFKPWRDAHFRGYVEEIERFLGEESGSLIPNNRDPTKVEKQAFKSRYLDPQDHEGYAFWDDEDVHLYRIIKDNIEAIQKQRQELASERAVARRKRHERWWRRRSSSGRVVKQIM
eukprot:GHVU01124945.1.p1 GENE.GHVU01124945.1~~GHVU01124945.1.p1  ORF type:complete len:544 (+),score=55.06 GHVU01124945.1:820-2451(+)